MGVVSPVTGSSSSEEYKKMLNLNQVNFKIQGAGGWVKVRSY